jgi:hypothetical protein
MSILFITVLWSHEFRVHFTMFSEVIKLINVYSISPFLTTLVAEAMVTRDLTGLERIRVEATHTARLDFRGP